MLPAVGRRVYAAPLDPCRVGLRERAIRTQETDMATRDASGFLAAALLALAAPAAQALSGQVVAEGLGDTLYVTAPAGDDRLFILEKSGLVRVMQGGVVQATPFLDLSALVDTEGERGLLGLAFDPGFAHNGRFYVDYIDKATHDTVVARYTVAAPGANVAAPTSVQNIITIGQPDYANHKGGWLGFRPGDTANLYIATGDGGYFNDPQGNAQNLGSPLGKILRVDVSGSGAGYAIPVDNPFAGQTDALGEVWAYGLRNPWRASFDAVTGDLWIGDVGQGAREEIDLELRNAPDAAGRNYGWVLREGSIPTPGVGGDRPPGAVDPILDYARDGSDALGATVIGGYVYRGPSLADADGRYFFGDFISNRVFSFLLGADGKPLDLREETDGLLAGTGLQALASFGEDGHGNLYLVGLNGTIVRVVPEPGSLAMLVAGWGLVGSALRRSFRQAYLRGNE
ncbi:MAG: glucose dehydrogenase [Aquabacterium sp.]|nr:MAG: glucose dehydrogenase [Aquabacterium sp.]